MLSKRHLSLGAAVLALSIPASAGAQGSASSGTYTDPCANHGCDPQGTHPSNPGNPGGGGGPGGTTSSSGTGSSSSTGSGAGGSSGSSGSGGISGSGRAASATAGGQLPRTGTEALIVALFGGSLTLTGAWARRRASDVG